MAVAIRTTQVICKDWILQHFTMDGSGGRKALSFPELLLALMTVKAEKVIFFGSGVLGELPKCQVILSHTCFEHTQT